MDVSLAICFTLSVEKPCNICLNIASTSPCSDTLGTRSECPVKTRMSGHPTQWCPYIAQVKPVWITHIDRKLFSTSSLINHGEFSGAEFSVGAPRLLT